MRFADRKNIAVMWAWEQHMKHDRPLPRNRAEKRALARSTRRKGCATPNR